jgi:hypothetical protein
MSHFMPAIAIGVKCLVPVQGSRPDKVWDEGSAAIPRLGVAF